MANIIITHDDGSESLYYLNDAGELCKIVHRTEIHSTPTVVASFEVLSRDDNRRITEIEENFLDPGAADDYRTERMTFTYGDGHLEESDLDTGAEAEPTKLYWSFADGKMLMSTSDPNRLAREVRALVDEGYSGGHSTTYDKTYKYDPNGNRLAVMEKDPADGSLRSITRYNYVYGSILGGTDEADPPGSPDTNSSPWTDYDGDGRDQLLSMQRFVFDAEEEVDRVEVESFSWVGNLGGAPSIHPNLTYRTRTTWRWDDVEACWWVRLEEGTAFEYAYDLLELVEYWYQVRDVPAECNQKGDVLEEGAMGEFHAYDDILGRRIATYRAEASGTTQVDYEPNKGATIHYDYYGLSQRVTAVRRSPFSYDDGEPPKGDNHWRNNGDQFIESYTYSPVGAVVRTDEGDDVDTGNNVNHLVAADLFGGTSALLLYTGAETDRALAAQHFDAFGVRMATTDAWDTGLDDSRYRWRSQEGSETDAFAVAKPLIPNVKLQPPTLVHMQTRHYDPALGRFIMADSIPMGAFSPQGLNRYAYCTNDPVNQTDATGTLSGNAWIAFGILVIAITIGIVAAIAGTLVTTTGGIAASLSPAAFYGSSLALASFMLAGWFTGLNMILLGMAMNEKDSGKRACYLAMASDADALANP